MLLLPPKIGFPKRKGWHIAILSCRHQRPDLKKGWGMTSGGKEKKKKKNKEKKKEAPVPSAQEPKTKGNLPRRSPAARSGDAIRVSAKEGESYADILKAMKAKVNPQNAGLKSSPFGEPGGRRYSRYSKRGVTSRPSKRRSTRRSGRRPKLNLWCRKGPLKLGTSTRRSQEKRWYPRCASRCASRTSGTSAGCTNDLAVCRLLWSV